MLEEQRGVDAEFRRVHLVDMEEETTRELTALQREKELLQAKEKSNLGAIDEVTYIEERRCSR